MGMMKDMDAEGDGMVSKKEWGAHHSMMWRKMNRKVTISMADREEIREGSGHCQLLRGNQRLGFHRDPAAHRILVDAPWRGAR
jgi:hypothetical protein